MNVEPAICRPHTVVLTPATATELCDAIRAHPRVLAVGARTKPRLSQCDATLISTRRLSGIVEYDPGEFTFTALAGTPLREIRDALAARGQYLPFDPMRVESGATIGGTVAAGLSGPGRFRYGGMRDFILWVRFADGRGQLLTGGAKVVKNAAGFDIPKFLAGSLGRYGVLVEITFKVFPKPPGWLTLRMPCESAREAVGRIAAAASARWELDAIDYADGSLLARVGGPPDANAAIAGEIVEAWRGAAILPEDEAAAVWSELGEFRWAHPDGVLAKIPITLGTLEPFAAALLKISGARAHFSGAGNVAFVSLAGSGELVLLEAELPALGLSGIVLSGSSPGVLIGTAGTQDVAERVRRVFDPENRFASLG